MTIRTKIQTTKRLLRRQQQELKSDIEVLRLPESFKDSCSKFTVRTGEGMQPFCLFPFQEVLNNLIDDPRYSSYYFLKSRQVGLSSFIAIKTLVDSLKNKGLNTINCALDLTAASQISQKLRYAIESSHLRNSEGGIIYKGKFKKKFADTVNDNKLLIVLSNLSQIIFKGGLSPDSIRGIDAVRYACIDEYLFQPYLKELVKALSPTQTAVGRKAKTFYLSTPGERHGFGYEKTKSLVDNYNAELIAKAKEAGEEPPKIYSLEETCERVAQGIDFCPEGIEGLHYIAYKRSVLIFVHFWAFPPYREFGNREDFLQYRLEQDESDYATVLVEYGLNFSNEKTSLVYNYQTINKAIAEVREESPDPKARYYVGIDTSGFTQSEKADYTALVVLKELEGEYSIADWYYSRHTQVNARIAAMAALIKKFKCTDVTIESNNMGSTYYSALQSLFLKENYDCGLREFHNSTTEKRNALVGEVTILLETEKLKFSAECPILSELQMLVRTDKGRIEAGSKSHDDMFFALAFAYNRSQSPEELDRKRSLDAYNKNPPTKISKKKMKSIGFG